MKSLSWKGSGRKPQLTIPELAKKYEIDEADLRKRILLSTIKFPSQRVGIISNSAVKRKLKYFDPQDFEDWWKLSEKGTK